MASTEYEIFTHVIRDGLVIAMTISKEGRYNLVIQEERLVEPPKPPEPEVAMKPTIRFSACGCFLVYENNEGQPLVCTVSKEQRIFIEAILAAENGLLASNKAYGLLNLKDLIPKDIRKMHKFVSVLNNRKLKGVALEIVSEDGQYRLDFE